MKHADRLNDNGVRSGSDPDLTPLSEYHEYFMQLLLIALTILFVLIAWMRLPWATLLVMATLPVYLLRAEFFGVPTTMLELMLIVVVIVWLIQNHRRARELFRIERRWTIVIALLVVSATVSAIIATDTMAALGIWKAYFIEPILFFYVIVDLRRKDQITYDQIVKSLMAGGVIVALFAIVQWMTGVGIPIPWDFERRVTGLFDYPNALGLYLAPLTVLSLSVILIRPKADEESLWFWTCCPVLFVFAIVLAQSEAALAAIIVTLIVMSLWNRKSRKKTTLVVIALAIVVSLIPTTRVFLFEKITLQDYSGQVRIGQWTETWELIKDHPVLGVGLSGYPSAFAPYHKQTHIEIFQYPHNIFLNIWVELGLLGLLSFFLLIFLLIRPHVPLFVLPLLTMFLHGLVDVPYFKNDLAVLTWILIALIYVAKTSTPKIQR